MEAIKKHKIFWGMVLVLFVIIMFDISQALYKNSKERSELKKDLKETKEFVENIKTIQFIKKTTDWVSRKFSNAKNSVSNLFVGADLPDGQTGGGLALVNQAIPEKPKSTNLIKEELEFKPSKEEVPTTQPTQTVQTEQPTQTQKSKTIITKPETTKAPTQPELKKINPTQKTFTVPQNMIPQSGGSSQSPQPPQIPQDTTAPNAPIIISPINNSTSTNSIITFIGTAEASSTISQNLNTTTTSADATGNWSLQLNLNQNINNIQFSATDAAGNTSTSTEINIFIDSTAPQAPSLTITECANSLTTSACLIATTTLNISWSSAAGDLDHYTINQNGTLTTTTATSTQITTSNNSTYIFEVSATDKLGNTSATSTQEIEINTTPVVINEIAWAGTSAQTSSDEWIELYNPTSQEIDMSSFILYSQTDQEPYINLSGKILAKGYYLIEGTDDTTVASTTADLIASFGNGLSNFGEVLMLSRASTTIDQTILCGFGATRWCPGFDYKYKTMEKISPTVAGTNINNWSYNNELITNGKTANGNNIKGTPKARNSRNYLINNNRDVAINTTLTKANSPYIVDNTVINIKTGATLTIEPGVVIKFRENAGLKIFGKILAQGTTAEPIVFTSFKDDTYAGDTNGDATSTTPAAKDWFGVEIDNTAQTGSTFNNTVFRFGGKYYTTTPSYARALLSSNGVNISVNNSIFEYSNYNGLILKNSISTISNNNFLNNINTGLASEGDASTLSGNTFTNNKIGLNLSDSPSIVSSNTFASSTKQAIISSGTIGIFTNNNGSNNGTNAIEIQGNLTTANNDTSLNANPLPYYLNEYKVPTVVASSSLTIETGTVIKGLTKQFNVNGDLIINGSQPSDIIFTSVYDDSISGDTTNDATSTTPAAGQFAGINITNTGSLTAKGFTMRYSGSILSNTAAGINLNGALANISEATFDNNYPFGIRAQNCDNITIENARFENHNHNGPWGTKSAIKTENSTTTLTSVTFENNTLGVLSDSLSTFSVSLIEWLNNTATTSPQNLF